jgi:hypothetical protein
VQQRGQRLHELTQLSAFPLLLLLLHSMSLVPKHTNAPWRVLKHNIKRARSTVFAVLEQAHPTPLTRKEIMQRATQLTHLLQFKSSNHLSTVLQSMQSNGEIHSRVSEHSHDRFSPWVYCLGRKSKKVKSALPGWKQPKGSSAALSGFEKMKLKQMKQRLRGRTGKQVQSRQT